MKGVVENNLPLQGNHISGFPGYREKASVNRSLEVLPFHLIFSLEKETLSSFCERSSHNVGKITSSGFVFP